MKTKTEIHANRFGLEFPVELRFVEKDDFGNVINDWFVDSYDFAKMALYKDATGLLPFEQEQKEIANILTMGVNNYLKDNL